MGKKRKKRTKRRTDNYKPRVTKYNDPEKRLTKGEVFLVLTTLAVALISLAAATQGIYT